MFFRHRARTIFPGGFGERVGKFIVEPFVILLRGV
jgi:hypothetical protein